ncbi:MAG: hypothetical protein IKB50_01470 [Clostridia bacterium]|nr:hypothetical protein [Clostridia bacterium]
MRKRRIISILLIMCMALSFTGCAQISEYGRNFIKYIYNYGKKTERSQEDINGEVVKEAVYQVDFEVAQYERYPNVPFIELLQTGIPRMLDPDNDTMKATIIVIEDWSESSVLNVETNLSNPMNRAVTYVGDVSTDQMTMKLYFFMEYDVERKVMVSKGGKVVVDDMVEEVDAAEIESTLDDIMSSM